MSQSSKPRHPGPPNNLAVRKLVEAKRQWSSPSDREGAKSGFRGWNERGYLPHRDTPDLIQFVTFRLANSFPEKLRSEWKHLLDIEDDRQRQTELESYLDKCRGECHLHRPEIARLVEDNFLRYSRGKIDLQNSTERYALKAWVVMPNHVHILFKVGAVSMSEIVGGWKRHTGRQANRLLGTQGSFWAENYFDTFIRDARHEQQTIRYIENNPAKAKLVLDPKAWPYSSARFRDKFGRLQL